MNRMAKVAMLLVLLGATKRLSSLNRQKRKRRAPGPDSDSNAEPRAKRRRYTTNSSEDDESDISSMESDISDDLDLLTESESDSSDSLGSSSSSSFCSDDDEDEEDSLDDLEDENGEYILANGFDTEEDETVDPLSLDSHDVDSEFEVKEEPADEFSTTDEKPDICALQTQPPANVMQLDSNTFSCLFNVPVKEEPEVHFAETTAEEILRDR